MSVFSNFPSVMIVIEECDGHDNDRAWRMIKAACLGGNSHITVVRLKSDQEEARTLMFDCDDGDLELFPGTFGNRTAALCAVLTSPGMQARLAALGPDGFVYILSTSEFNWMDGSDAMLANWARAKRDECAAIEARDPSVRHWDPRAYDRDIVTQLAIRFVYGSPRAHRGMTMAKVYSILVDKPLPSSIVRVDRFAMCISGRQWDRFLAGPGSDGKGVLQRAADLTRGKSLCEEDHIFERLVLYLLTSAQ